MIIDSIEFQNDGYIHCKSSFYSAHDILKPSNYTFFRGTNKLTGEIDSGIWAISYLISMYKYQPDDFILFKKANVMLNNKLVSFEELAAYSCYMDKMYPLFSTDTSVKKLVEEGLAITELGYTAEEIRQLFYMDSQRFERPIRGTGNERFKAMAAIGFCHGKQIFCFPWLSKERFDGFHYHLSCLPKVLEELHTMVILPIGN